MTETKTYTIVHAAGEANRFKLVPETDPRTMTEMFLFRACRPGSGVRLDAFIEAENEERALDLHQKLFGYYDSQPDYPDRRDIEIIEVPFLTGEARAYGGFELS